MKYSKIQALNQREGELKYDAQIVMLKLMKELGISEWGPWSIAGGKELVWWSIPWNRVPMEEYLRSIDDIIKEYPECIEKD